MFARSQPISRLRLYYLVGGNNKLLKKEFNTTRDGQGKLLSVNSADPSLLIGRGKHPVRPAKVYIPKQPLRVTSEAVKHLSSLPQFHGIPDESLIGLAERKTKLYVPDRWVAIVLILGNRIPIPVPNPQERPRWQVKETTAPAKLRLIQGGRIVR
jgi:hypothetical protein